MDFSTLISPVWVLPNEILLGILLRLFTGDDRLGTRLLHLGCMIDEKNDERQRERETRACSFPLA